MTIHWKPFEHYFTVYFSTLPSLIVMLENVSILELALSGVKGLSETIPRVKRNDRVKLFKGK